MLLPADLRDVMREDRLPAKAVLQLFQFDHVVLHAHDGSNKWHNLTPMQFAPHRQKSRQDTKIIAKVDRIIAKQAQHEERRQRVLKPEKVTSKQIFAMAKRAFRNPWPKRKIPSRPLRRPCVL